MSLKGLRYSSNLLFLAALLPTLAMGMGGGDEEEKNDPIRKVETRLLGLMLMSPREAVLLKICEEQSMFDPAACPVGVCRVDVNTGSPQIRGGKVPDGNGGMFDCEKIRDEYVRRRSEEKDKVPPELEGHCFDPQANQFFAAEKMAEHLKTVPKCASSDKKRQRSNEGCNFLAGCGLNLLKGIWKNLTSTLEGAKDLFKWIYNNWTRIPGLIWSGVRKLFTLDTLATIATTVWDANVRFAKWVAGLITGVEDATSDSGLVAAGISDHVVGALGGEEQEENAIIAFGKDFMNYIVKAARENFAPDVDPDCYTCKEWVQLICGVIGFAGGELVTAFLTGGTANAAKLAITGAGKAVGALGKVTKLDKVTRAGADFFLAAGKKMGNKLGIPERVDVGRNFASYEAAIASGSLQLKGATGVAGAAKYLWAGGNKWIGFQGGAKILAKVIKGTALAPITFAKFVAKLPIGKQIAGAINTVPIPVLKHFNQLTNQAFTLGYTLSPAAVMAQRTLTANLRLGRTAQALSDTAESAKLAMKDVVGSTRALANAERRSELFDMHYTPANGVRGASDKVGKKNFRQQLQSDVDRLDETIRTSTDPGVLAAAKAERSETLKIMAAEPLSAARRTKLEARVEATSRGSDVWEKRVHAAGAYDPYEPGTKRWFFIKAEKYRRRGLVETIDATGPHILGKDRSVLGIPRLLGAYRGPGTTARSRGLFDLFRGSKTRKAGEHLVETTKRAKRTIREVADVKPVRPAVEIEGEMQRAAAVRATQAQRQARRRLRAHDIFTRPGGAKKLREARKYKNKVAGDVKKLERDLRTARGRGDDITKLTAELQQKRKALAHVEDNIAASKLDRADLLMANSQADNAVASTRSSSFSRADAAEEAAKLAEEALKKAENRREFLRRQRGGLMGETSEESRRILRGYRPGERPPTGFVSRTLRPVQRASRSGGGLQTLLRVNKVAMVGKVVAMGHREGPNAVTANRDQSPLLPSWPAAGEIKTLLTRTFINRNGRRVSGRVYNGVEIMGYDSDLGLLYAKEVVPANRDGSVSRVPKIYAIDQSTLEIGSVVDGALPENLEANYRDGVAGGLEGAVEMGKVTRITTNNGFDLNLENHQLTVRDSVTGNTYFPAAGDLAEFYIDGKIVRGEVEGSGVRHTVVTPTDFKKNGYIIYDSVTEKAYRSRTAPPVSPYNPTNLVQLTRKPYFDMETRTFQSGGQMQGFIIGFDQNEHYLVRTVNAEGEKVEIPVNPEHYSTRVIHDVPTKYRLAWSGPDVKKLVPRQKFRLIHRTMRPHDLFASNKGQARPAAISEAFFHSVADGYLYYFPAKGLGEQDGRSLKRDLQPLKVLLTDVIDIKEYEKPFSKEEMRLYEKGLKEGTAQGAQEYERQLRAWGEAQAAAEAAAP